MFSVASRSEKSLSPAMQGRLKEALQQIVDEEGGQDAAAKYLGLSAGYVSELRSGGRGGGAKILNALFQKRPELLARVLGMATPERVELERRLGEIAEYLTLRPGSLVSLWDRSGEGGLSKNQELPEHVHRAAMATVYLEGVTIEAAYQAAVTAWLRNRDSPPGNRPKAWLDDIRDALPESERTGVRPVMKTRKSQ